MNVAPQSGCERCDGCDDRTRRPAIPRGSPPARRRPGRPSLRAPVLRGKNLSPPSPHAPCRPCGRPAAGAARRDLRRRVRRPRAAVEVNGLRINYDDQGEGEPLLLIPYTSADHACYAFQLPAYTEYFSCVAIDLPGSGESDKPTGPCSTEGSADQVAAFLGALGIERAHVAGVSLGATVGMHLAARHPARVRSLSLHSSWHASDPYLKTVVEQWRTMASALPTVADVVIQGIFPWCFTPEMYVDRPEFVDTLVDFVRGRPAQPVAAFLAPDRRGHRPRREHGAPRDRRSDPHHVRSP